MLWKGLHAPFLVQAPMDDVTDVVFRQILAEEGRPDVFFTEFVNVEALCSDGRKSQERRLEFTEDQRPIVAQIWGKEPEHFRRIAGEIAERGFDGIDINMGCPDRTVIKNGLCAALIADQPRAAEIIAAVKEGVKIPSPLGGGLGRGGQTIPISIKTRIGIRKPITEEWIGFLLEQNLDAITIHGRTVKDMSKVPAQWEEVAKAVKLRDSMKKETAIIGNGDVTSRKQAIAYGRKYGVDGIMIGRGIFQNIWLFHPEKCDKEQIPTEKLRVLRRHVELYRATWGESRSFEILKKFMKVYVAGLPGAAEIRKNLMETKTYEELLAEIEK